MSVSFQGVVLVLGKPNLNGHIYSVEEIEKALTAARARIARGNLTGQSDPDYPQNPDEDVEGENEVDENRVTHVVDHLWIEYTPDGPVLMGHVHIIPSPLAHYAEAELAKDNLVLRPFGSGIIDDSGIVTEYRIRSIDLIMKESAA